MKSPGHQKWPDHKVEESQLAGKAEVEVAGKRIAYSDDVIRVTEDGSPERFYFSRSGVSMDKLEPSSTTTYCPFKGTANYFNIEIDGKTLRDAVWSYEEPFDEHQSLKGRLAFYDDKYSDIDVHPAA